MFTKKNFVLSLLLTILLNKSMNAGATLHRNVGLGHSHRGLPALSEVCCVSRDSIVSRVSRVSEPLVIDYNKGTAGLSGKSGAGYVSGSDSGYGSGSDSGYGSGSDSGYGSGSDSGYGSDSDSGYGSGDAHSHDDGHSHNDGHSHDDGHNHNDGLGHGVVYVPAPAPEPVVVYVRAPAPEPVKETVVLPSNTIFVNDSSSNGDFVNNVPVDVYGGEYEIVDGNDVDADFGMLGGADSGLGNGNTVVQFGGPGSGESGFDDNTRIVGSSRY